MVSLAASYLPGFEPLVPTWRREQAPVESKPALGALRPYQVARIEQARANLAENRSTLIVMATGTGKTRVFGELAKAWDGRVLVLAHRRELIRQARDSLQAVTGERVGVERAGIRSHGERIVVASKDSLHPDRLSSTFKPDDFSQIIVDEAHHAVALTYRRIIDYFEVAKVVGVTATPDRADEAALGRVFDSVCEPYDILDGINEGYLCPIEGRFERIPSFDLKGLRANGAGGDYGDGQLGKELERNDATLKTICEKLLQHAETRKSILFLPTVETAHVAAATLNLFRPGCARSIDGTTDDDTRDRIVSEFRDGDLQIVVNCGVFTEGADFPRTALVGIARMTKSRSLYAQMVGRGTRIFPGKDFCIILDFAGASDVHGLMCPEDLLGGTYDTEVIELAQLLAKEKGGATHKNLAEAAEQIKARRAEAERIAARKAAAAVSGKFDPFRVLGVREPSAAMARYSAPPTDRQVETIEGAGIPVPEGLSKAQASAIIGKLSERWRAGLASLKQVKLLSKYGIAAADMQFSTARKCLDAISANGWRLPPDGLAHIISAGREPGEEG